MSLPSPSEQVHRSITAAMAWYDATAIEGKRYIMVTGPQYPNGKDHLAIEDPSAPPIWARLYDVKTSRPIFSDRDGRVYDSLGSISYERRLNYHWYGYWGWTVQQAFAKWSKQIGGGQQSSTSIRP
jgi:pectate lyase